MAAIIYRDIVNDFSPITYNGNLLPYGITNPILHFTDVDPVSPPCSPRIQEIRPRIIFHEGYCYRIQLIKYKKMEEMKMRQHKYQYKIRKKNMKKYHRKTGKLKQPGGSSCNQRKY